MKPALLLALCLTALALLQFGCETADQRKGRQDALDAIPKAQAGIAAAQKV